MIAVIFEVEPAEGRKDEYLAIAAAVLRWRCLAAHRSAQSQGRSGVFDEYRLRIAQ